MDMGWVLRPVTEQIVQVKKSFAKYPSLKTGEEFKGYAKSNCIDGALLREQFQKVVRPNKPLQQTAGEPHASAILLGTSTGSERK